MLLRTTMSGDVASVGRGGSAGPAPGRPGSPHPERPALRRGGARPGRRTGAGRRRRPASWDDERGTAAVEAALIFPVLVLFVTGIVQFGLLFFSQNTMQQVAWEAARRVAVGELTVAGAPAWATGRLPGWLDDAAVTVQSPGGASADVSVRITAPMASAAIIDPFGILGGGDLEVEAVSRNQAG